MPADTAIDPDDFEKVWHDMYGNGRPGLLADVRDIKRVLFRNDDTGSPGLVRDVQDIKEMVTEMRGGWKFIKWAVGLASSALVLIQLADKLGVFRGAP